MQDSGFAPEASPMNPPRQLVLLCDGTNNNLSGRHSDTHVVLLAELLRLFPDGERLVYYDPGVGNPGQLPGTTVMDKVRRALDRLFAAKRHVHDPPHLIDEKDSIHADRH